MSLSRLPNELLFKILVQILGHSVHMVVVSPGDVEWHLHAHHTLSAVCYAFREIMKGISTKAFQFTASEANPSLARHTQRQLQTLRRLGAAIRDPSAPGNFSIESLDPTAPQLVQGYSLYIAVVYLRTQATRSTAEIYHSTSETILGAVITLSKVLYSRIVPREVAAMLKWATEDEAALSHFGVLVVKYCGMLKGFVDVLVEDSEKDEDEVVSLRRDPNKIQTEQVISDIDDVDVEFLALARGMEHPGLPCCTDIWLAQLPDVYSSLERAYDLLSKSEMHESRPLVSEDALAVLRGLVERWAPPPPTPPPVHGGATAGP